jgi:hypothetical protein
LGTLESKEELGGKMKSLKVTFLLGLMLAITTGCVKSNGFQVTESREIPTKFLAGTSYFTATPTQTIRNSIPSSTLTPQPNFPPIFTHSITPLPTSTVIPTLPVEAARSRLLYLLDNNGNCYLPCLWGIIPGESTFQDARKILEPLASISDFTNFSSGLGAIDPIYTTSDLMIYTTIRFITFPSSNIVSLISFDGRALREINGGIGVEDVFFSNAFGEKLKYFMLPNILSEYGKPTAVLLSTLSEFPPANYGQGHFKILLIYPNDGILIHYTTEMRVVGNNVLGCPLNAHVDLELLPSGDSNSFFSNLSSSWQNKIQGYLSIEITTLMTIDSFYETFRNSPEACIETPANLWPMPER